MQQQVVHVCHFEIVGKYAQNGERDSRRKYGRDNIRYAHDPHVSVINLSSITYIWLQYLH